MKTTVFTLLMLFMCGAVEAGVTATIVDVFKDPIRGTIVVETEYRLDGKLVQTGHTRYDENSGTQTEIRQKIASDVKEHSEALIRRVKSNETFIRAKRLERQGQLTQPLIDTIKPLAVGVTIVTDKAIITYKGKEIEVSTDSVPVIRDAP